MSDHEPEYRSDKFKCPHCGVISQQRWFDEDSASSITNQIINHTYYEYRSGVDDYQQNAIKGFISTVGREIKSGLKNFIPSSFSISTCASCNDISLWVNRRIVYPNSNSITPPNEDLDADIQSLYNEASNIFNASPKGSTALLRLALQNLLKQIGKEGKNINNDIKELVAEGLSVKIQQALDLVRVVGNNAVHPGQIDLDDDKKVAIKLFHLVNFIANELITKPRELEELYTDVVPDETKEHIKQRDGKQ